MRSVFSVFYIFLCFLFGPLDEKIVEGTSVFVFFPLKCLYIYVREDNTTEFDPYNNKGLVRFQVAPLRFL